MRRVLATDGSRDPLNGVCIFFLRLNATKPISTSNIAEVSCSYVCVCVVWCGVLCMRVHISVNSCSNCVHVPQELCFGTLDATKGQGVLQVIEEYLNLVMLPALTSYDKWGQLSQQQVAQFMAMLRSFNLFLSSMEI